MFFLTANLQFIIETLLLCLLPLNPLGRPGQDINKFVNHVQLDDELFKILDGYYGILCNIVTEEDYAKSGEISLLFLPVCIICL
jgi:hypothetical protein